MIAHIYDRESQAYDSKYQENIHLIEDKIVGTIIKSCLNNFRQNILDVGCGTGHVISLSNISHLNYQGVDISYESVKQARKKFPKHYFTQADITNCEPTRKQDLVLMIYGQVNYIGLNESTGIIKKFLKSILKSKFICVMYCGYGHQDYEYTKLQQNFYKPSEIKNAFKKNTGIDVNINGFSFLDVPETYDAQWHETLNLTMVDGEEMKCKYLIVSNVDILNEK